MRPPWIEPSWLVLPLALVPLIAVPALLLLRHFAPPQGHHRKR